MTDMTISQTIADQIGRRTLFMLGAKSLLGDERSLRFQVRGSKVTHIRITLGGDDLYAMEFLRCRGLKVETLATEDGVYADMLHAVIERHTGLRTSL
jgi:hypothetical protein